MKKKQTENPKSDIQRSLFEMVQNEVRSNYTFAETISEVLGISVDSAYRRIRGEITLDINEIEMLCKKFSLSFDALLYGINKMQYSFIPPDFKDIMSYEAYANELASITEKIISASGSELIISAADIPAFHYVAFRELALFQLFSWHKNVFDFSGTYEDFHNEINTVTILQSGEKTFNNYLKIPSIEIWTDHTTDSMLKMIKYHCEMEHFINKTTPLLLCKQLIDMVNTLHEWMKEGKKGKGKTPFKFYLNEVDIGNTFIYVKSDKKSRCIIRLFTINGLSISDNRFCREASSWLDSLIKRSTLISEVSTKERSLFITRQKQKITALMDFIKAL